MNKNQFHILDCMLGNTTVWKNLLSCIVSAMCMNDPVSHLKPMDFNSIHICSHLPTPMRINYTNHFKSLPKYSSNNVYNIINIIIYLIYIMIYHVFIEYNLYIEYIYIYIIYIWYIEYISYYINIEQHKMYHIKYINDTIL